MGARWPRVAVALATGIAAAVLAGCGSSRAGASLPQPGPLLRQALRAWSGFPVSADPRPLVLTGPPVADPQSGFPDGATKLAYVERALVVTVALPSGPANAGGFPLISAREAVRVFSSTGGKGPPANARLTVTTVRLGAHAFLTDRGARRLPAWLFGFRGIQDPAAVLAVAPAHLFSPPGAPANRPGFVTGARLGRDGRTLTVEFTGAKSGTGPCTADYGLRLADSRTAVAIVVREHVHGARYAACSAVGYSRQVTKVLSVPLGNRVIVDALSGAAVAVTEAAPEG